MKHTLIKFFCVSLVSLMFLSVSQSAQAGSLQSFATDKYYLGAGGTPPTLSDFATNPRAYLRSDAAYLALKRGFETALGRSLSDLDFKVLLADTNQVRATRACTGRIRTTGISWDGKVGWSTRPCYAGEMLIELKANGRWIVVASQGCFNLSRLLPPVSIPQPKLSKVCRFVKTDVQYLPGGHVVINGIHNHNKYCGADVSLPGMTVNIPGGVQTSSTLVCE